MGNLIFEKFMNVVFVKLLENEKTLKHEVVLDKIADEIKKKIKNNNFNITDFSFEQYCN